VRCDVASPWDVAFDPAGRKLAIAGGYGVAGIVDLVTGDVMHLRGHRDSVASVAFDPTGRRLLTSSRDGTVRVWDTGRGERLLVLRDHGFAVHDATFSPDGGCIVSVSDALTVRVWESRQDRLRQLWAHRLK